MPILAGAASLTRFNVSSIPAQPDFDSESFREIAPGSELRESVGFVPFEPGADWQANSGRWAFRVRIDKLTPDPTGVAERFRDLIKTEQEISGQPFVGPKKRRELRQLAQEELLMRAVPRSRIVEAVIDDGVLYVATTADLQLGKIMQLLRRIEIIVDFKTPWIDLGQPDAQSEVLDLHDPVRSAHGAHFLESLLGDPEIKFEPVGGYARLQTRNAKISLTGAILRDVHRYVQEDGELLAAKLIAGEFTFRLDALAFRIGGLSVGNSKLEHWTEQLDERLERIRALWDLLDRKYSEHQTRGRGGPRRVVRAEAYDDPELDAELVEATSE